MRSSSLPPTIERYWQAVTDRDGSAIAPLVTDDFVEDWPQSGERIRGAQAWRQIVEGHPTYPQVSVRRIVGAGDLWVCQAEFDYGSDAGAWRICAVMELRDGLVARVTQYFGAPFPAADWRASIVEQI